MEKYNILILLALITMINSVEFCDLTVSATDPKECNKLIKASYTNYCCLFKGKWKGIDYPGNCMDLTPVRYNEMKEYIEETNKEEGYHIESLDCKAFDLQIGILYLFFMIISLWCFIIN